MPHLLSFPTCGSSRRQCRAGNIAPPWDSPPLDDRPLKLIDLGDTPLFVWPDSFLRPADNDRCQMDEDFVETVEFEEQPLPAG